MWGWGRHVPGDLPQEASSLSSPNFRWSPSPQSRNVSLVAGSGCGPEVPVPQGCRDLSQLCPSPPQRCSLGFPTSFELPPWISALRVWSVLLKLAGGLVARLLFNTKGTPRCSVPAGADYRDYSQTRRQCQFTAKAKAWGEGSSRGWVQGCAAIRPPLCPARGPRSARHLALAQPGCAEGLRGRARGHGADREQLPKVLALPVCRLRWAEG